MNATRTELTDLQRLSIESTLLRMLQEYIHMDHEQSSNSDTLRQLTVKTRKEIEAEL